MDQTRQFMVSKRNRDVRDINAEHKRSPIGIGDLARNVKGRLLSGSALILFFALLVLGSSNAFGAANVVGGKLLSVTQSGPHSFDYTYALVVRNGVPALDSATITASTRSKEIQIIQGQVSLGPVAANSKFVTDGTIVLQVEERDDDYFEELSFRVVPGPGPVAQAQINGATGGTITVNDPGDPLSGTQITFPPGALSDSSDTITIGYSNALPAPLDENAVAGGVIPLSPTITLNTSGTPSFNYPVTVTVPYSNALLGTQDFPVVIYWDPTLQQYQPLQVTSVDQLHGYVSFVTKHFTEAVVTGLPGLADMLSGATLFAAQFQTIDSGFRPQTDGFEIRNFDTGQTNIAHGGACYGLTSFAVWYFAHKSLLGTAGLYQQYAGKPDAYAPHSPQEDAIAREVAGKAFVLTLGDNQSAVKAIPPPDVVSAEAFIINMALTHAPQLVLLKGLDFSGQPVLHSVIVYFWDASSMSFYVYDPNFPFPQPAPETLNLVINGSSVSFAPWISVYTFTSISFDAASSHFDASNPGNNLERLFTDPSFGGQWLFNNITVSNSPMGPYPVSAYPGGPFGPSFQVDSVDGGTELFFDWLGCKSFFPCDTAKIYYMHALQNGVQLFPPQMCSVSGCQVKGKSLKFPPGAPSAELLAFVSTVKKDDLDYQTGQQSISFGYSGFQRAELCGDGGACWDFVSNFSAATNPNGVWSYKGNGDLLTQHGSAAVGGSPNWWNGLSQPNSVFIGATTAFTIAPSNYYTIDPQSNTASVAFTAPESGNYLVSGSFIGAYATVNPHPVTITVNGSAIWSSTVSTPLGVSPFSTPLSLRSGDVVSFNVLTGSTGCTYCYLGTGLSASISKQ